MNKIITYGLAALAFGFLVSCSSSVERDIETIKARITNLESTISELNNGIADASTLIKALSTNDYIKSVQETSAGCVVVLQSGTVIALKNANDGNSPIIGLQDDSMTGYYCWTVRSGSGRPTWLLDSYGRRITAETITPRLRVFEGFWQVSYDEGSHWSNLFESIGGEGSSVFRSVDWSDPYYVRFTLAGGSSFVIPTSAAMDEIYLACQQINRNIASCRTLLTQVSGSYFVNKVEEMVEKGQNVGYILTMDDGSVFTLRNGQDTTEEVFLGIALDDADGKRYWTVRYGDEAEPVWLYVEGSRVPASPTDNQPLIGVRQEGGILYFTVGFEDGHWSWMTRGGERVQAQATVAFNFFKKAVVDENQVYLITESGQTIMLVRNSRRTLSLRLPAAEEVYADTTFRFFVEIAERNVVVTEPETDIAAYLSRLGMTFRAVAVDGGYALAQMDSAEFHADVLAFDDEAGTAQCDYRITVPVRLQTPSSLKIPGTTRVAFFLAWGSNTTMKVLEFENRVRNPKPVPGEDPEPGYDPLP